MFEKVPSAPDHHDDNQGDLYRMSCTRFRHVFAEMVWVAKGNCSLSDPKGLDPPFKNRAKMHRDLTNTAELNENSTDRPGMTVVPSHNR